MIRDRSHCGIGLDLAGGGIPVNDRQLDIHQDEIRSLFCYRYKRLLTVLRLGNLIVGGASISRMIWRLSG